jgi:hypothetical protein
MDPREPPVFASHGCAEAAPPAGSSVTDLTDGCGQQCFRENPRLQVAKGIFQIEKPVFNLEKAILNIKGSYD